MPKTQTEVPGTERPTIEAIDALAMEDQKALKKEKTAKTKAEAAKASVKEEMMSHIKELEKDSEGNHVYLFRDGDLEVEYVIPCTGSMRRRKPKAHVAPEGDIG